ncbi:uncharacterized protein FRV6_11225 [Fusarium oxysporum]|uniref:Uncharacterized protein n=1 Tax=Fusarium oxysporum TaxID=5507 RepID=A0A2H3TEI0_FUSOX|nr:uncharacterized protein FRV6_11225 [Fusarium oxysporum]
MAIVSQVPLDEVSELLDGFSLPATSITTWVGKYLNQVYPEFKLSDWLTPLGVDRVTLFIQVEVEGSQSVRNFLFDSEKEIVQPEWMNIWSVAALKQIADPVRGFGRDLCLLFMVTKIQRDLEVLGIPGVGHFPGMYATQSVWMDWIEDWFERRKVHKQGYVQSKIDRFLPDDHYQHD